MSFQCGILQQATTAEERHVTGVMDWRPAVSVSVRWAFAVKYCDYCLVLETDGGNGVHSGRQQGCTTAAGSQVGFRNQASESLHALWWPWTGEHILAKTDKNIVDLDRLGRFPELTFRRKQYRPTQNLSHSLHLSLATGTRSLGVRFAPRNKSKSNLCAILTKYITQVIGLTRTHKIQLYVNTSVTAVNVSLSDFHLRCSSRSKLFSWFDTYV
jgi:hypothetical protein